MGLDLDYIDGQSSLEKKKKIGFLFPLIFEK